MLRIILSGIVILVLGTGCTSREAAVDHPDFSGLYRPAGLEVQPCGRNEWMRRSFETDTFCNGDDSAFPFTDAGRERWKSYNVIDDPVLGCVEDFPRNAMRGRPMRITLGEDLTEIAYWFNNEWFVRTVHMNGEPAAADTPNTVTGFPSSAWRRNVGIARPSLARMRAPYVLKMRTIAVSTPCCRWYAIVIASA